MATITYNETVVFVTEVCCNCGVHFAIPQPFQKVLIREKQTFYCPNGHGQSYSTNEADRLRQELKRKEQELADVAIEKLKLQNEMAVKDKQLKRLKNGVCPCCNRSFHNLQQHISKQHPELIGKEQKIKKP